MKPGDGAKAVGVAAAACAICCTGPILGFFAATGLGTLLGITLFGAVGILIAVLAVPGIIRFRRRWRCEPPGLVAVEAPRVRTRT